MTTEADRRRTDLAAAAEGGSTRDDEALWELVRSHHAPAPLHSARRAALVAATRERLDRRSARIAWRPALAAATIAAAAAALLLTSLPVNEGAQPTAPASVAIAAMPVERATDDAWLASALGVGEDPLDAVVTSEWSAAYAGGLPAEYELLEAEIFEVAVLSH